MISLVSRRKRTENTIDPTRLIGKKTVKLDKGPSVHFINCKNAFDRERNKNLMYTKKKTSNRQANFEIDTYLQLEQVGFVQMIAGNAKQ